MNRCTVRSRRVFGFYLPDTLNDVAVILITLKNHFDADYVDFHAQKKGPDGWKIIAKVFTEA